MKYTIYSPDKPLARADNDEQILEFFRQVPDADVSIMLANNDEYEILTGERQGFIDGADGEPPAELVELLGKLELVWAEGATRH